MELQCQFTKRKAGLGLVNIALGPSSAPEVEREVLEDVGSYGKQLGRNGDVLTVLPKHASLTHPTFATLRHYPRCWSAVAPASAGVWRSMCLPATGCKFSDSPVQ